LLPIPYHLGHCGTVVHVCLILPGWDLTVIQEFLLYRFGKNDQLPKEVKSKLIHLPHIIDTFASHKPDDT